MLFLLALPQIGVIVCLVTGWCPGPSAYYVPVVTNETEHTLLVTLVLCNDRHFQSTTRYDRSRDAAVGHDIITDALIEPGDTKKLELARRHRVYGAFLVMIVNYITQDGKNEVCIIGISGHYLEGRFTHDEPNWEITITDDMLVPLSTLDFSIKTLQ